MDHKNTLALANILMEALRPGCLQIEIVGSVKRADKQDYSHDIEILAIADPRRPPIEFGRPKQIYLNRLEKVIADMQYLEMLSQALLNGDKQKKFQILKKAMPDTEEAKEFIQSMNRFALDLFIVRSDTWGIQNVIRTGPDGFSKRYVTNKSFGGLLPNHFEYLKAPDTAIRNRSTGETLILPTERDAIEVLGLGWIEPYNRKMYVK